MARKPTQGQLELYKAMKSRHISGEQFTKEDMLKIYNNYVFAEKRFDDFQKGRLSEDQLYNNASHWMESSICSLLKKGYLGLNFRRDLDGTEEFHSQGLEMISN